MRLDRGLYNQEWLDLFPHSKLFHTPFGFSDHLALLTKIKATISITPRGHKHRFFFGLRIFGLDPECEEVIKSSWDTP